MGVKLSTFIPRYIKNFNIDQRVSKQIEKIEKTGSLAPRHPSTAAIFKEIEKSAPVVDEKNANRLVVERTKEVKVYTNANTTERATHEVKDKRPKKENELAAMFGEKKYDIDFEKYGYTKPEKIKDGNLTLRQFDEILNEYKSNKSVETINNLSQKYKIEPTNLHIMFEYYKPFYRLSKNTQKAKENDNLIGNIFPNVNLLKSQAEFKSS